MTTDRSQDVAYSFRAALAVGAVLSPVVGCASNEAEGGQQSFVVGWLLLALLVLFMLVLFGGLLRYLKAGKKREEPTERSLDYEYKASEEDEEEL